MANITADQAQYIFEEIKSNILQSKQFPSRVLLDGETLEILLTLPYVSNYTLGIILDLLSSHLYTYLISPKSDSEINITIKFM